MRITDLEVEDPDTSPTSLGLDDTTETVACSHRWYVCAECGADMMGMMTLLRVLPDEMYDKIMDLRSAGPHEAPARTPCVRNTTTTNSEEKERPGKGWLP